MTGVRARRQAGGSAAAWGLTAGIAAFLLMASFAGPLPRAAGAGPALSPESDLGPIPSDPALSAAGPTGSGVSPAAPPGPGASAGAPSLDASVDSGALAQAKHDGVDLDYLFPPHPSPNATERVTAAAQGHVQGYYRSQPAPVGLSYLGLSAGANGSVQATELNTSSVQGRVDTTGAGIVADDLDLSTPDAYSIQLNAVATNVVLFGHGGYSFWVQAVLEVRPAAQSLALITNVWNFSSSALEFTGNALYAHGPNGVVAPGELYYSEVWVQDVSYPWNATLTVSSNLSGGRDAIYFTVGLTGPSVPSRLAADTFDWVVFNSIPASGASGTVLPANFTANGLQYNPAGLVDDFELDLGGPGGGSEADFASADAALGLAYWNATAGAYQPVPAAYSYGTDTGETASGATVAWSDNASAAPGGLASYGTMTTGPSFLEGLWNLTGPEGSFPVALATRPSNAFTVVTPLGNASSPFLSDAPSVAAGAFSDVIDLTPGAYAFTTELSGYVPVTETLNLTGPTSLEPTLVASGSAGLYTPLWATNNSQLAAISSAGTGTPQDPYVLFTGGAGGVQVLGPEFGLYNDYTYPVYPGLLLQGTNASVEVDGLPEFAAPTECGARGCLVPLPAANDLPLWVANASDVALVNTTVTGGWFSYLLFNPGFSNPFDAVFYASTDNLVWNDTFASPSSGLLLFEGPGADGLPAQTGGDNTIWGNTFYQTSSTGGTIPSNWGVGIEVAESGDLVFNNYVATPTTAAEPSYLLYSGQATTYRDSWNITPDSAPPSLTEFPFWPLTGPNILGGPQQSGNYWWDYGDPLNFFTSGNNSLGVLPYRESVGVDFQISASGYYRPCQPFGCSSSIASGGDASPLTYGAGAFYEVQVHAAGVSPEALWGFQIAPAGSARRFPSFDIGWTNFVSEGPPYQPTTLPLWLPAGRYAYASTGEGLVLANPHPAAFDVTGNLTVSIGLRLAVGYGELRFVETGLPVGTWWYVFVFGYWTVYPAAALESSTNTVVWIVPVGPATVYPQPSFAGGFETARPAFDLQVDHTTTTVRIRYVPYRYPVEFRETGLPPGRSWSVHVTGTSVNGTRVDTTVRSRGPTLNVSLPNGTFNYTVGRLARYTVSPGRYGNVTVDGGPASVTLQFGAADPSASRSSDRPVPIPPAPE